ncbi:nucleoside-binding protein [Caloramator quimbayensis]|uniref:Nucleoside-binding protein n=1 Tax=Caloramator quimbayensis TaxID=1147123 RepID=A0A1T4XVH9_9CLOT|nr:BMP family ABC transporter substrate-binding protein [Caloramator quimbayensis]SKA93547.1 nucleoside-binding protein [Caloramator quimbayensis]
MKKLLSIVLAVLVTASLFAGCGQQQQQQSQQQQQQQEQPKKIETSVKIGLATDEGGKGDKSFNDAAIAGLDKIASEYTVEPVILESKQNDQYEPNLKNLASANDLVFAVGFKMQDALTKVAKAYPDKKFAIIDSVVELPNVESICFKEEEGSFLMGVIAAKTSQTGKIGFVGGSDMPLIQKFEAGFIAGVKSVNPEAAKDLENRKNVKYANSFSDINKGYELAKSLYNSGCDVIYHAAGGVGLGVFNAAKEMKKWAIGVDSDQALTVPDAKDVILCSMLKRVDVGTYSASKDTIENKFQGGKTLILGLKEDGVGVSPTVNPAVQQSTLDLANKYKEAIVNGTIVVPSTLDDVKKFQPVEIK